VNVSHSNSVNMLFVVQMTSSQCWVPDVRMVLAQSWGNQVREPLLDDHQGESDLCKHYRAQDTPDQIFWRGDGTCSC
jgi:hypothetical protein